MSAKLKCKHDNEADLDGELWDPERVEDLARDGEDFGVGEHGVVHSGDVKVLSKNGRLRKV